MTTDRILGIKNKSDVKQNLLEEVCVTSTLKTITNDETENQTLQEEKILLFGNAGKAQEQQERDEEIMKVFKEAKLIGKSKSEVVKSKSSAPRIYTSNIVRELPKIINNQNVEAWKKRIALLWNISRQRKNININLYIR